MSLIKMPNFCRFVVFFCLTSVVTSTRTKVTAQTDNIESETTVSHKHVSLVKGIYSTTLQPLQSFSISTTNDMSHTTIMGEGGPIEVKNKSTVSMDEHNSLADIGGIERHAIMPQSTNNRAEVKTKIVPRKGADQSIIHTEGENISQEQSIDRSATKPIFEPSTAMDSSYKNEQTTKSLTGITSDSIPNIELNVTKVDDKQTVSAVTRVTEKKMTSNETPKPTHKPKPTLTIGGPGKDKPIRITPTTSTLDSMPRKIDYIVPIVITVVALPLLAAVALVMYRRGRDCWDKRHYRRMDFLIDGMYND